MALFQQSVLKKYLAELNAAAIQKAWQQFQAHFHVPEIQQNISNAKEEEYQEGFVRDLFVQVLGFTLKPQPNFNLVLEQKTAADSTKSDGAFLRNGEVIGVLELKDTNTTDLEKVEKQVFGYKHKHPQCVYVITANFRKLRFYINDAIQFLEFDLFTLQYADFALLYCCLHVDALQSDRPLQMKQASLAQEESVTKKLYADYSRFKKQLFNNIVELNPQYNKLELFKKTQKLLDRFLFIFFAEDRGLLPPNLILRILDEYQQAKKLRLAQPLYERFKLYFLDLHQGNDADGIFAYNGGLFAPDDLLDNLQIQDELLFDSCKGLSNYDFESEVDVNILGHIFEHSLSEMEEIERALTAVSEPVASATKTSKRKKDGVFYTPRYITKYIVENTVGTLCQQQKEALQIVDEAFTPELRKQNKEALLKKLDAYRDWLLQLTICDPACGSGAFLNQALEFLIAEHQYVDELRARLFGDAMVMRDVEASILENNLYGVDINEEAVEIAKLSLWLRTAHKGRKLNDLSQHIKCGNSLIDDPAVAGEKAFNWQQAFPAVFAKGGFDVVIGNPPYVDIKALDSILVSYLFDNYDTTENRINLYSTFIEKGLSLIHPKHGNIAFIVPNSLLLNSSYQKLRQRLFNGIREIIKLPDNVFIDAKVETIIFFFENGITSKEVKVQLYKKDDKISFLDFNQSEKRSKEEWKAGDQILFNIQSNEVVGKILQKIESNKINLEILADFSLGITPYDKYKGHSKQVIEERQFHSTKQIDEYYKPLIGGDSITRYLTLSRVEEYIKYGPWLGAMREERFFTDARILVRQIVSGNPPRIYASYSNKPLYFTQIGFGIIPKQSEHIWLLLCIINSRLITFFHKYRFLDIEKNLFQKILIANCKKFPICLPDKADLPLFEAKANDIIDQLTKLFELKQSFSRLIQTSFSQVRSKTFEDLIDYSNTDFLTQLKKQNINLGLSQKAEWLQYFEEQKAKALQIQHQIETTDKEIDSMVYSLYGLTEEEIKIIEADN